MLNVDRSLSLLLLIVVGLLAPGLGLAAGNGDHHLDLTNHWVGFTAIGIFALAYALVMAEEFTNLRKSKPVILAAGLLFPWQSRRG